MTLGTFLRHGLENGLLDVYRQRRIMSSRSNRIFYEMLKHKRSKIGSCERFLSSIELVSYATKCILVTFLTHCTSKLLRCHISRSTNHCDVIVDRHGREYRGYP